ncbi:MAG: MFS transporter [Anaerolineales bacterium]|nr:MAG: MFS transporter [Anaerolineales bacterium]
MEEKKTAIQGLGAKFMRLWQASFASNLADGVWLAAGPLLAASLTRDPLLIAGLATAQRLPWLLFSLPSGVIVDRMDRKRIIWIGNAIRGTLILALGLSTYYGLLNIYGMYVFFFLLGTVEPFVDNASFAILPRVVTQPQLEKANGRLFATTTVANDLVGPPAGSFIFTLFPPLAFLISSIAYGGSAVLMGSLPGEYYARRQPGAASRLLTEIWEGFRWFLNNRVLRALALLVTLQNLVFTAGYSLLVLYAQDRLGLGATGYGLLLSVGAVGGLVGAVTADRIGTRLGTGSVIVLGITLTGLAFLVLGFTHNTPVAAAMLAVNSFSVTMSVTLILALRQTLIPDDLLGRVTSVYRFIVIGTAPLGSLAGGLLARRYELGTPYWVGGVVILVSTLLTYRFISNKAVERAKADLPGSSAS